MKAKVINEKYQIFYKIQTENEWQKIIEDVEFKDCYWRAFQIAGTYRCAVTIGRMTTIEIPNDNSFSSFLDYDMNDDGTANVMSGYVTIDAEHFANDVKLSRYNSVNGWVIPDYIDLEEVCI